MDAPNATRIPPPRGSGILLHPTCLPSPYGIGDLGPGAYAWVDWLSAARQSWWQILPLAPTGYGDSPYACLSAFAGNANLVSPELLLRDDLLHAGDLAGREFPAERVDFGMVLGFKAHLLHTAWERFRAGRAPSLRPEFDRFCAIQHRWLEDYALYRALKDAHGGRSWLEWDEKFVLRDPAALARAREQLADAVDDHRFSQFLFFRQWRALREHAHAKGLRIIGDAPIFMATDSADVWARPQYFDLDARRRPRVVAGVPPDYFSSTGQLWGNPLYRWDVLARDGFAWWIERLRSMLELVDLVRIDHFRGFESCWEVGVGMPTAENGRWVPGPGATLFAALRSALGGLPILAEDLGIITPEVDRLRECFALPGMIVLQFAFGGDPYDRYLPHNHPINCVVYTGTHDNDTTRGWYATLPEADRAFLARYLGRPVGDVGWELLRLAWGSVGASAIAPLQDVLDLGSEARMNLPGRADANWTWRFQSAQLDERARDRLVEVTTIFGRVPRRESPSGT